MASSPPWRDLPEMKSGLTRTSSCRAGIYRFALSIRSARVIWARPSHQETVPGQSVALTGWLTSPRGRISPTKAIVAFIYFG